MEEGAPLAGCVEVGVPPPTSPSGGRTTTNSQPGVGGGGRGGVFVSGRYLPPAAYPLSALCVVVSAESAGLVYACVY